MDATWGIIKYVTSIHCRVMTVPTTASAEVARARSSTLLSQGLLPDSFTAAALDQATEHQEFTRQKPCTYI